MLENHQYLYQIYSYTENRQGRFIKEDSCIDYIKRGKTFKTWTIWKGFENKMTKFHFTAAENVDFGRFNFTIYTGIYTTLHIAYNVQYNFYIL